MHEDRRYDTRHLRFIGFGVRHLQYLNKDYSTTLQSQNSYWEFGTVADTLNVLKQAFTNIQLSRIIETNSEMSGTAWSVLYI